MFATAGDGGDLNAAYSQWVTTSGYDLGGMTACHASEVEFRPGFPFNWFIFTYL